MNNKRLIAGIVGGFVGFVASAAYILVSRRDIEMEKEEETNE